MSAICLHLNVADGSTNQLLNFQLSSVNANLAKTTFKNGCQYRLHPVYLKFEIKNKTERGFANNKRTNIVDSFTTVVYSCIKVFIFSGLKEQVRVAGMKNRTQGSSSWAISTWQNFNYVMYKMNNCSKPYLLYNNLLFRFFSSLLKRYIWTM